MKETRRAIFGEADRKPAAGGASGRRRRHRIYGGAMGKQAVSVPACGSITRREQLPEVEFGLGSTVEYTFVYEKTRIQITDTANERNTGDQLMLIRFTAPSPWRLDIFNPWSTGISGKYF